MAINTISNNQNKIKLLSLGRSYDGSEKSYTHTWCVSVYTHTSRHNNINDNNNNTAINHYDINATNDG